MFDLKINNFRSYKNETFNFSRINILIGENSSGKSSLFKFLLALKQTFSDSKSRDYNLALNGDYADLGTFKDVIYYNDTNLNLDFEFTFGSEFYYFFRDEFLLENFKDFDDQDYVNEQKKKIDNFVKGPIVDDTKIQFSINKHLDIHESLKVQIVNSEVGSIQLLFSKSEIDEERKVILSQKSRCDLIYYDYESNEKFVLNVEYNKEGFLSIVVANSLKLQIYKHYGFSYSIDDKEEYELKVEESKQKAIVDKIFHKIGFLLVSQNYIQYILNKMEYINPLDTKPQRIFLTRDEKRNINIKDIEDVVDFLSNEKNVVTKSLTDEFRIILKDFGLAEGLEVVKDDRLPVKELKVKIKDLLSNITDVGYGVALQIPVLLKALLAERITTRKNTLLLIEQPEVHLHPKMHAKFIETLLSMGDQNFYFIETHSEHLVRKLQVMVKERKFGLVSNDISINYLVRDEKQTRKTIHRIEENGMLNPPFPEGFFDNSYLLARDLLN